MHEGQYYRYILKESESQVDGSYDDVTGLLHFINRLLHPLLDLDSEAAIEQFLDNQREVVESTSFFKKSSPALGDSYGRLKYKTRVLVFILDRDEYETELKFAKDAGRLLASRVSHRIGLVTDRTLIRLYKSRKGALWFNDYVQSSTIVLQRFDDRYFSLDILQLDGYGTLVHFIIKRSLLPVTEIDDESNLLVEMAG